MKQSQFSTELILNHSLTSVGNRSKWDQNVWTFFFFVCVCHRLSTCECGMHSAIQTSQYESPINTAVSFGKSLGAVESTRNRKSQRKKSLLWLSRNWSSTFCICISSHYVHCKIYVHTQSLLHTHFTHLYKAFLEAFLCNYAWTCLSSIILMCSATQ